MQQTKLNLWLSPSAKQHQNHCSGPPPALQDLSKQHDCLVKRVVVDFLIRMKGNSKCLSGNSFGPLTRISALAADVTNRGKVPSATQAETTASLVPGVCLLRQETWELPVKEATLHLCLPWHQFHITVSHTMWSVMQDCKVWNSLQASSLGGGYEGKLFFSLTPRGPQTP